MGRADESRDAEGHVPYDKARGVMSLATRHWPPAPWRRSVRSCGCAAAAQPFTGAVAFPSEGSAPPCAVVVTCDAAADAAAAARAAPRAAVFDGGGAEADVASAIIGGGRSRRDDAAGISAVVVGSRRSGDGAATAGAGGKGTFFSTEEGGPLAGGSARGGGGFQRVPLSRHARSVGSLRRRCEKRTCRDGSVAHKDLASEHA